MGLITRLKSLLGLGDERSKTHNHDNGVTIEREPTETRAQPNAESEKAVKMSDSPTEDTSVSTEELVDEGAPADHIEEAEPEATEASETAAEPAEATGPSAEAGQPAQTEATESEPEPDADSEGEAETEAETDEVVEESETDIEVEAEPETETKVEPETESEPEPEPESGVEPEPETELEPEPEIGAESGEEGRPLEDVKGIGPAYAERLRNAGVENAAQLAVADAMELARETDLSVKRIEGWMERAKSM